MKKQHGNTGKRNAAKEVTLDSSFAGRCFRSDKAKWVKAANAKGMKLKDFIIESCNNAASGILSSVRANSAWHIENLIEHNPECQVVELCVAEQLEEKCNTLTNRVKVLEEALKLAKDDFKNMTNELILSVECSMARIDETLEADNGR